MGRRNRHFRLVALVLGVLLLFADGPALAQALDPPLPDPVQEARARELHKQFRCLVCQNQSIVDSNADLARDLRVIVRERISAGDSDQQVRNYMVERYGDWVLLNPPFKATTLVLWLGPAFIFFGAALAVFFFFRRTHRQFAAAAPLNRDEKRRLDALLGDGPD